MPQRAQSDSTRAVSAQMRRFARSPAAIHEKSASASTTMPLQENEAPRHQVMDMLSTCKYVLRMGMIQIRNVPDDLHRELKARAALAGMSLSDYLLRTLRREVDRPSREEWFHQLEQLERVEGGPSSAEIIRELRGPLPTSDDP